jgi:hypothetical protein
MTRLPWHVSLALRAIGISHGEQRFPTAKGPAASAVTRPPIAGPAVIQTRNAKSAARQPAEQLPVMQIRTRGAMRDPMLHQGPAGPPAAWLTGGTLKALYGHALRNRGPLPGRKPQD